MRLPVQVPVQASSSVVVPSFSVPVVPAAIRHAPAPPQALLVAFRRAAGPCIPPVPRPAARRVAVLASANARVARADVPALAPVLVAKAGKPTAKRGQIASKFPKVGAGELLTLLDFVRYGMSRFVEATNQHIPFLLRKAERVEEYLQQK